VLLIQRALVIGFSLADLKRVLATHDRGGAPCRSVRELVGHRLNALNGRIEELLALRDELSALLSNWDARLVNTAPGQRAHLLETLGSTIEIERARRKRKNSGSRSMPGPYP
jgi:DNA-binding transcriptional MerR regulator